MNPLAKLTNRERDIAELSAWGACKKEIANHLSISVRTVENHFRNIYRKTECSKATELSAWWFCSRFNISFSLSPLARKVIASIVLAIYLFGATNHNITNHPRVRISSSRITCRTQRIRKNKTDKYFVA